MDPGPESSCSRESHRRTHRASALSAERLDDRLGNRVGVLIERKVAGVEIVQVGHPDVSSRTKTLAASFDLCPIPLARLLIRNGLTEDNCMRFLFALKRATQVAAASGKGHLFGLYRLAP
jgi:hypothetical protein